MCVCERGVRGGGLHRVFLRESEFLESQFLRVNFGVVEMCFFCWEGLVVESF